MGSGKGAMSVFIQIREMDQETILARAGRVSNVLPSGFPSLETRLPLRLPGFGSRANLLMMPGWIREMIVEASDYYVERHIFEAARWPILEAMD